MVCSLRKHRLKTVVLRLLTLKSNLDELRIFLDNMKQFGNLYCINRCQIYCVNGCINWEYKLVPTGAKIHCCDLHQHMPEISKSCAICKFFSLKSAVNSNRYYLGLLTEQGIGGSRNKSKVTNRIHSALVCWLWLIWGRWWRQVPLGHLKVVLMVMIWVLSFQQNLDLDSI